MESIKIYFKADVSEAEIREILSEIEEHILMEYGSLTVASIETSK